MSFLPLDGGRGAPDPKRIGVLDCEFRARLTLAGEDDRWWAYGTNEAESDANAQDLIDVYCSVGRAHFDRASRFPEPFESITPERLGRRDLSRLPGRTTLVRACLAMSRISLHLGDAERTRQFAEIGLSNLGRAVGLRAELRALSRAA